MQRLIIKTGSALPALRERLGDYEDWIAAGLGEGGWRVVDATALEALPPPAAVAGVVVTGSPAMVSDRAPWSVALASWLRRAHAAGLPLLGICYGHQLLADALGGEVGYHPAGAEVGFARVKLTAAAGADPLFCYLPASFDAAVIHWQSVLRLPPGAVRLAGNDFEPNHAFRVGESVGVQFHPEFSAEAIRAYLGLLAERLAGEGLDARSLAAYPDDLTAAAGLLRRFAARVRDGVARPA